MISNICRLIGKIDKDKILHFLICYVIFDYCLSIGEYFNFNIILTLISSFTIISSLIFLKEVIDENEYNGFNWYDILAGYIGVITKTISFMIQVV